MHFGAPVVPDEYRIYSGSLKLTGANWTKGSQVRVCSNKTADVIWLMSGFGLM